MKATVAGGLFGGLRSTFFPVVLLLSLPRAAVSESDLLTEDYLKRIHSTFAKLYNLEYEASKSAFEELKDEYAEHPGPPLDVALVLWQRDLLQAQRAQRGQIRFSQPLHPALGGEDAG